MTTHRHSLRNDQWSGHRDGGCGSGSPRTDSGCRCSTQRDLCQPDSNHAPGGLNHVWMWREFVSAHALLCRLCLVGRLTLCKSAFTSHVRTVCPHEPSTVPVRHRCHSHGIETVWRTLRPDLCPAHCCVNVKGGGLLLNCCCMIELLATTCCMYACAHTPKISILGNGISLLHTVLISTVAHVVCGDCAAHLRLLSLTGSC